MTQEPITPKANHRVIDVAASSIKDSSTHDSESNDEAAEPFQTHPSFFARLRARIAGFFQKLGWVFLILVVALLGYLSWTNNQNDWQIEHINTLQAQVGQLKSDLKGLKQQQMVLSQSVDDKKGLTQEQQTQIESIAMLESKLQTVQQQVSALQSKSLAAPIETPENAPDKVVANETNVLAQVTKPEADASAETKQTLTQLSLDVQEMKRQLATLNNGQAQLVNENNQLKTQMSAKQESSLSATQIQHWAMQINTDWMLTGDQYKTLNALNVLQQAVEASDLTEKTTLLTQIALDQQILQTQLKAPSIDAAMQAIAKLNAWMQNWQPALHSDKTANATQQSVSHETAAPAEQSIWQKLEQKLLSLFSIRKRDDNQALTQAEQIAQQDVIKQRFALLLDRVEWAVSSHSQSQLQSSRAALMQFVAQQLANDKASFENLFQPLASLQFAARQPLKVVGG